MSRVLYDLFMDYSDFVTKQDIRRVEKQNRCRHHSFTVISKCNDCGKLVTVKVDQINSIPAILEQSLFCKSHITRVIKNIPPRDGMFFN